MEDKDIDTIIEALRDTNNMLVKTGCELLVTRKDGVRVSLSRSNVMKRWEIDIAIDDIT